jgi:hypothetical protein
LPGQCQSSWKFCTDYFISGVLPLTSTLFPHHHCLLAILTVCRVQPHGEQSTKTTVSVQNSMSWGICGRLSHWLRPTLWGSPCEAPTTPRPTRQPYNDCKACREWHVVCDHAKPQCSHCCQEQILCFYIDPTAKPKIKRKPKVDVPILKPIVPPSQRSPGGEQTPLQSKTTATT